MFPNVYGEIRCNMLQCLRTIYLHFATLLQCFEATELSKALMMKCENAVLESEVLVHVREQVRKYIQATPTLCG